MQGNVRASVRETREHKNQRRASKALTSRRDSQSVVGFGEGGNGRSSWHFLGNCGWKFFWPIQLLQSNWVYNLFFSQEMNCKIPKTKSIVQIFLGFSAPSCTRCSLPRFFFFHIPVTTSDKRSFDIWKSLPNPPGEKQRRAEEDSTTWKVDLSQVVWQAQHPDAGWHLDGVFLNESKQFQGAKATEVVTKGSELYQN